MRLENQISRWKISCPEPDQIEKILLQAYKQPLVMKAFENHLIGCQKCQGIVRKIRKFYEILEKELAEPISPKVVDFTKSLQPKP